MFKLPQMLLLVLAVASVQAAQIGSKEAEDIRIRSLTEVNTKESLHEAGSLEAQLAIQVEEDHAAGMHDKMITISDDFLAARANEGTEQEQALRVSFHANGYYHTLFHVAESLDDYSFLEAEVKEAHDQQALMKDHVAMAPVVVTAKTSMLRERDIFAAKEEATAKNSMLRERDIIVEKEEATAFLQEMTERKLRNTDSMDDSILLQTQATVKWGRRRRRRRRRRSGGWWETGKEKVRSAARKVEENAKRVQRAAEEAARKVAEAARKVAEAAKKAAQAMANAVTSAINWLKDKKKQIGDGAAKIVDNVNSAKDLAGEVKKEILVTAKKIKANVIQTASTIKAAAKHIQTPFKKILYGMKTDLGKALQNKDDCKNLKIKPTGVSMVEKEFGHCFTLVGVTKCPKLKIPLPAITWENKKVCNPANAVKDVVVNAFKNANAGLMQASKDAIDDILKVSEGTNFLEASEGQGGSSKLLAHLGEQQEEQGLILPLHKCRIEKADFAVWFRYGISFSIGQGNFGMSLSANIGMAFGCDGDGTAFMFPTVDIGLDLTAGVGVTSGIGWGLGIDLFANFDTAMFGGADDNRQLLVGGTGKPGDSSIWGNKLGWGLGVGFTVGDWGLGFSLTLPSVTIGTSRILGIDFPTSGEFDRPKIAGIGVSGPASSIFSLVSGNFAKAAENAHTKLFGADGSKTELSMSLGIGYVGIIGDKRSNWFKRWAETTCSTSQTCAPPKGSSCNNLFTSKSPKEIWMCDDNYNVFEALPPSILKEWPYK